MLKRCHAVFVLFFACDLRGKFAVDCGLRVAASGGDGGRNSDGEPAKSHDVDGRE